MVREGKSADRRMDDFYGDTRKRCCLPGIAPLESPPFVDMQHFVSGALRDVTAVCQDKAYAEAKGRAVNGF